MTRLMPFLAAVLLVAAAPARASWFESCEIEGEVSAVKTRVDGGYSVLVKVAKSVEAKTSGGISSHTDCTEHVNNEVDANFSATEVPFEPRVGDTIYFLRSASDGFSSNGAYGGTSGNSELRLLRRPKS